MLIEVPDCQVVPGNLRVQLDTPLTQIFALSHSVTVTRCLADGTSHEPGDVDPVVYVNGMREFGALWRHANFPGDILIAMIWRETNPAYAVVYRRVKPGTWQASTDVLLIPQDDYPASWGDEDSAVRQRWARAMLFASLAVMHDRFDGTIPQIVPGLGNDD